MSDGQVNNNTTETTVQVLKDVSSTGKARPWSIKKLANQYLSIAYDDINKDKANRLRSCAQYLVFAKNAQGEQRLKNAVFCRVRLCPMCNWRRELKVFYQVKRVMEAAEQEKEHGYVFLTLTIRNCEGYELSAAIDEMMGGFNRFMQLKDIRKAVKGWYRGFEVTHNIDRKSKDFDTYHPHLHMLLCVNKSYFKNDEYLTQAEWTDLWQASVRTDYAPRVNVKKVYGSTVDAVAETAKYAVKDGDYIIKEDWDLTLDAVRILDAALHRRRFVAFGGLFKKLHKKLNLDDAEDGDLIVTDDEQTEFKEVCEVTYAWNSGYSQYVR